MKQQGQLKPYVLKLSIYLLWVSVAYASSDKGLTCMSCPNSTVPHLCRETTQCGENQICSTKEYLNNDGFHVFRLGCENATSCKHNAKYLFGKRDLSAETQSSYCHECCYSPECNIALCAGPVKNHVTETTTTRTPTKTTMTVTTTTETTVTTKAATTLSPLESCTYHNAGCPANYVGYKNNCYYISLGSATWIEATQHCRRHRGHLTSLTSTQEQAFLRKQLYLYNVPYIGHFLIGGMYNHSIDRWVWQDGHQFRHRYWNSLMPRPLVYERNLHYYTVLMNPTYSVVDYTSTQLFYIKDPSNNFKAPFICKSPKKS